MFSENIDNLIRRQNVVNDEIFLQDVISNEVKVKLNMFWMSMRNRVGN